MKAIEAARVIRAVALSIRDNPGQFNIEIYVTGQRIQSLGGTGLHIEAVGGAAGSNTIGQVVSVDGSHVSITRKLGMQAMDDQRRALEGVLELMATQLETSQPDQLAIRKAYESLKGIWVPGVITSVVGNLLTQIGMLLIN